MNFVFKPSLQKMALVKIGISLWNNSDIMALISKLTYRELYPINWGEIEETVIGNVPQLSLPQILKEKVFGVVKPIGKQIHGWMLYYHKHDGWIEFDLDLDLPAHLPTELCWTPQGTVDRKKTAEVLVKDESLDVSKHYRQACDYCLKDDIIRFWNRLPEDLKNCDWSECPVIRFWSDNMKSRGAVHISYKDVFESSVRDSNKVAAKYFLQKLTPEEREESLKELAKDIDNVDVLCFLLPEMEKGEQKIVLKNKLNYVLKCFLKWPWQSFFIGVANCMWDFVSKRNYLEILADIICKVNDVYKDYNYQKLFIEFWQKSLKALKDSLIEEIDESWLLHCFFDFKDKENIRLILNHATLAAKAKLIYSDKIDYYLTCFILENEWDFLEFLIRECLPSKSDMLKFKQEFEKRSYSKECSATQKHEWNQIFSFSDVSICKYGKRSAAEGESSSSKRFQSLE